MPIVLDLPANLVQDVLARYESGQQFRQIAKDLGTTHVTLYKRVIAASEETWKELQVARALARKEEAEEEMETAPDNLTLARARERLKAAQWDLERVCRRIYGTDSPPQSGQGTVQININLTSGQAETEVKQVSEE